MYLVKIKLNIEHIEIPTIEVFQPLRDWSILSTGKKEVEVMGDFLITVGSMC